MIKIDEDLYVAADAVAAVERPERSSRDLVKITMKDGTVYHKEFTNSTNARNEVERIVREIDLHISAQAGD